jgi:hypothetical protein
MDRSNALNRSLPWRCTNTRPVRSPSHRLSDQEQADSFVETLVLVVTPNGGEILTVGQPVTILWKSASRIGLVAHQVKLSTDRGATYNQDISPRLDGMARSYAWTPTADTVTKEARVRVVAIDRIGNWGADDSDGTFIIQVGDRQSPAVKVLYPNGGERLQPGQQVLIQWKSDDNVGVASHIVLLSPDGGSTYSDISGPLDGTAQSFLWTVPRLAIFEALIRVVAVDRVGNQGMDDSDGKFTIQFPMKEAIKDKEVKEHWEGKDVWEKDVREFSSQPMGVIPPMQRLTRLEAAFGQLMHFIRPDLRPTMDASALTAEPGLSSPEQAALSQLLQKQASAAKQAKDTKDVEKLRER